MRDRARLFKKRCRQADSNTVSDQSNTRPLQENHADHPDVGNTHGFQGTEVPQIVDREEIKRLAYDCDPNHKPE